MWNYYAVRVWSHGGWTSTLTRFLLCVEINYFWVTALWSFCFYGLLLNAHDCTDIDPFSNSIFFYIFCVKCIVLNSTSNCSCSLIKFCNHFWVTAIWKSCLYSVLQLMLGIMPDTWSMEHKMWVPAFITVC